MTDSFEPKSSQSLLALLKDLPSMLVRLLKAELAQLAAELKSKAIHAGVGIGLLVFASLLLFFMAGALVAAAVLALSLVFTPWLAALLTAAGLLILAGIVGLVGMRSLKGATPLMPQDTVSSVKEDVNAIKGMGKYDH